MARGGSTRTGGGGPWSERGGTSETATVAEESFHVLLRRKH